MRRFRQDLLTVVCLALLVGLVSGCSKQGGTGLIDRLAGQGSGSSGSEGARSDESAFLPDPSQTPGDTLPVTADDVCTAGYAGKVRNVGTAEKDAIYQAYGITHHAPHEYEIDHLISLELGGSNKPKNLWPQSYQTRPWNAHVKDRLEDKLHEMVCTGQIDLATAQHDISTDWIATYRRIFHTDQPTSTAGPSSASGTPHRRRSRESDASNPPTGTEPESGAGSGEKVWVNTHSGKFFLPGSRYYGKTREGEYLSESEAVHQGYQASGGQR
jgi:hypothetical protein